MPALREPGLGPIVGHVTDTSCRVWIRGDETGDEGAALDSERRTLGVATILEVPKADRAKLRTDEGLREVRDSLVGQVKAELQKATDGQAHTLPRSEEHTYELQSLMRISYPAFSLQK